MYLDGVKQCATYIPTQTNPNKDTLTEYRQKSTMLAEQENGIIVTCMGKVYPLFLDDAAVINDLIIKLLSEVLNKAAIGVQNENMSVWELNKCILILLSFCSN